MKIVLKNKGTNTAVTAFILNAINYAEARTRSR
jgi:hypothetical protein